MTSWITLTWNSTDSIEFHGGTVQLTGGRQSVMLFPQDDDVPDWHDPNRRTRVFVIAGTFHATTFTKWHEEAFEASTNTTYPYLTVYEHWNATSSSMTTTQHKVVLREWQANPTPGGTHYTYKFSYAERG